MIALNIQTSAGQFVLRFVQESNEIEELSVPEHVLMSNWAARRGNMGMARRVLELAERHKPLSVDQLCEWQAAITREQLPYGHWIADEHIGCLRRQHMRLGRRRFAAPEEIGAGLHEMVQQINAAVKRGESAGMLELAAETHWRFELIHPFADGNGRTGRLLALYCLRAVRLPPVLFTAGDRESRYYRAFDPTSPEIMVRYFREHQLQQDPWA